MAQLYARAARAGLTDAAVWTPLAGGGQLQLEGGTAYLLLEGGGRVLLEAVASVPIDGYFDAPYNPLNGMEGNRPCLRAPASVVAGAVQGDVVTVGGVSYTVAEVALHTPDPHETLLWLRKAA